MDLWQTRKEAIAALESSMTIERDVIARLFGLMDECILNLEKTSKEIDPQYAAFARVAGLTALKGRNFALASYSLILDGLAQEAGAIVRPLIEVIELLRYLCVEPAAVEQAIESKLPSAGMIAKKIEGKFQDLRNYLNAHASHFAFKHDAIRHVVDLRADAKFRLVQPFTAGVLRTNLGLLFSFLVMLAFQCANCLKKANHMPVSCEALVGRITECSDTGSKIFEQQPR